VLSAVPIQIIDENNNETYAYKSLHVSGEYAHAVLPPVVLTLWRILKRPRFYLANDEIVAHFDLGAVRSPLFMDFLRFMVWKLGPEKYVELTREGVRLLILWDLEPYEPPWDSEPVTPRNLLECLLEDELNTWLSIGEPSMVLGKDGNYYPADEYGLFLWEMATDWISDEDIDRLDSSQNKRHS
jgi:hypothetical protein